jgi:long-chain fatty acid transport protein
MIGRVALAVVLLAPATASAGGITVPGMGPQAQARAGAFVARVDDPTAIAHNPAGFAKLDGTVVFVGMNFVKMALAFTRAGNYENNPEADLAYEGDSYPEVENDPSPSPGFAGFQGIPYIAVSTDFGRPAWPVRAAIGVYAPHGFSAREFAATVTTPEGNTAPAPQRYDVFTQSGKAALPSIAASYRVAPGLDIGARFSSGFAVVETDKVLWGFQNFYEWGDRDAISTIEATDPFVPSFGAGALWRPSPAWEVGVGYASTQHIRAKGTVHSVLGPEVPSTTLQPPLDEFAECEPGGVEGALKICVDLNLPQTATVGGRWILRDAAGAEKADVELDLSWEDWSNASVTSTVADAIGANGPLKPAVVDHGFMDVLSVRLGGSYAMQRWQLRGGMAYDTKTAPQSWTRLDQDGKQRATFATGVAYTAPRWRVELGGGFVWEPDRTVPNDCLPPDGPAGRDEGCGPGGARQPVEDRTRPDPAQPLDNELLQSPFNAGTYKSHYVLMHLGLSTWF